MTTAEGDVVVAECTRGSVAYAATLANALATLYGDTERMCGRDNVQRSCFAAELCSHSKSADVSRPLKMLTRDRCYAALSGPGRKFVGLVALDDDYIYGLCTSAGCRSSGVGRSLLERVLSDHGHRMLWLTVATPVRDDRRGTVEESVRIGNEELERRCERLVAWYERYGFKKRTRSTDPSYIEMERLPLASKGC